MNMIRRIVVGLAGVFTVAMALQMAAPKAVHAVVSTLVTVTNTPNVSVVNTPAVTVANTVPVTGTVAISSMPPVTLGGSVNADITNTIANAVPTHNADRLPSALITLRLNASGTTGDEIPGDGTINTNFTIPSGDVFVVTDYYWEARLASPNTLVTAGLFPGTSVTFDADDSAAEADANGFASKNVHLTTGIVCTVTQNVHFLAISTFGTDGVLSNAIVHGYLAPNQ